jgi:glycosyltransferase involved in cell wall biosynthesis
VIGGGDITRFSALADRAGLADHYRFFGTRNDPETLLAAADVFIAPTMYETFSIAGYEAAACGLPIVATKVNGLEDLIGEHQQRGRFIGNDAASIASVAFELAGAPQLRRELGERARQYATEFTWDRSATTVLEAYEKIMAGKTR